jgi:hypothetical protein
MLELFQEASIPKLSETALYMKFNETSDITNCIKSEITQSKETIVAPETIKEILALIRLNGDAIAKKSVDAYLNGEIVIIFNKATSKIPASLPFIVMGYKGTPTAFVFADKVVNNITSASEYTSLMAVMEAAYLALKLNTNMDSFLMNAQLMLTLCNIYTLMVVAPLEQRLYMKGDNLNKAMMYVIVYFYNMFRGDNMTVENIPFKRLLNDRVDPGIANQIIDDVVSNPDKSFMGLLKLISKINPIRYKDLDAMYLSYFTSTCGVSLIFALENIAYLFLLISSASYKTQITSYSLNKTVAMPCKKAVMLLTSVG